MVFLEVGRNFDTVQFKFSEQVLAKYYFSSFLLHKIQYDIAPQSNEVSLLLKMLYGTC